MPVAVNVLAGASSDSHIQQTIDFETGALDCGKVQVAGNLDTRWAAKGGVELSMNLAPRLFTNCGVVVANYVVSGSST